MRLRLRVLAGVAATAVAATAGAGGGDAARTYTFFFVADNASSGFSLTMEQGADAAAAALGNVQILFEGSPVSASPSTQIPYLKGAIDRHPDAILIDPTDESALVGPLRKAVRAGIPVATVESRVDAPLAFTSVGTDDRSAGEQAAAALARAVGGGGEVVALAGRDATAGLRRGAADELERRAGVRSLGTRDADEAATLLAGHPSLTGIVALDQAAETEAAAALKAAGRAGRVRLVGFGAGPGHVRALRTGAMDALVVRDAYAIGQKAVELAYAYVTGHRAGLPKRYRIRTALVTRANLDAPATKRYLYAQ